MASLLPAGETDALQRVKRHLQQIFAAAGQATALVHSDDFWEKVRKYTSKILESTRAPVCNLLKVPITFVDAAREIVRFMCQQIAACAGGRPSQTHLVGTCGEASSYIKEVLDDAAATLAETLSWLTSKKFWSAFREFTDATGKLPENCAPLARTTVRQRAADAAKTFLALPNEKRQAYLGGAQGAGARPPELRTRQNAHHRTLRGGLPQEHFGRHQDVDGALSELVALQGSHLCFVQDALQAVEASYALFVVIRPNVGNICRERLTKF